MSGGRSGFEKIGGLVDALLEEKGLDEQVRRMGVLELWPTVVGERIAEVTKAKSLSGATLFVEVRSSAWASELDLMKTEIMGRLNESAEAPIEKIVFLLAGG